LHERAIMRRYTYIACLVAPWLRCVLFALQEVVAANECRHVLVWPKCGNHLMRMKEHLASVLKL
jgi:hypothetical protein